MSFETNTIKSENFLTHIADSLSAMAVELNRLASTSTESPIGAAPIDVVAVAQSIYQSRRRRMQIFADEELFGEPAWDILLDLFVATRRGKQISVTSACIASAVPSTTALRWLRILESKGLIVRETDSTDARRTFVRLADHTCAMMEAYLAGHQALNPI